MFENNFFKKIVKNTEEKTRGNESILSKVRKMKSRNLILTMAFVSGLNQAVQAKELGKTTEVKNFKSEVINSNDKVEFQAVNYFASDSDFISKEAEEKISSDFKELLDQVNEENYKQIIEDGIYIYSSADPEKTNNFKNNEELARARANSLIKLLEKYLASAEVSHLSKEESKEFKDDIKFFVEVPTSSVVSDPQIGVTYPEDLGYSKESLAHMSASELDEIYARCRKVVVSLGVYKNDTYYTQAEDFIAPISPRNLPETKKGNIEGAIKWNADNIVILVDNSPSVGQNSYKEILSKIMNDNDLAGKEIQFSFFSNELGQTTICENVDDVINIINKEKFEGNRTEQALSSALIKLKSIEVSDKNKESTIMKTFTDENLQNVSLDMVNSFEEEALGKNTKADFYYVDKENGLMQISQKELKEAIEKRFLEDIQATLKNNINNKKKGIIYYSDKNKMNTIKKQLEDLSKAYDTGDINGVLNSPILNEVYNYRDAKTTLMKKNIPTVSLKNLGHRASTSDGNLVYNQNL